MALNPDSVHAAGVVASSTDELVKLVVQMLLTAFGSTLTVMLLRAKTWIQGHSWVAAALAIVLSPIYLWLTAHIPVLAGTLKTLADLLGVGLLAGLSSIGLFSGVKSVSQAGTKVG